jgi:hypothetical protein
MDRLAQDALSAINDALARHRGHPVSSWPLAPPRLSPVEVAWAAQPFAVDVRWQHGQLRWRTRDGRITHWTPPEVVQRFVAACDRGEYPQLGYELLF